MKLRRIFLSAVTALLLAVIGQACAQSPVTVRYGNHDGFGRIVIDAANAASLRVTSKGQNVVVELGGAHAQPPGNLPRNVVSVEVAADELHISLKPGSTLRRAMINHHLVLDALDPSTPPPPRDAAASLAPVRPQQLATAKPPPPPAIQPPAPDPPAQPVPPPSSSAPADPPTTHGIAATLQDVPDFGPGHRLEIPFGPQVGAAAFAMDGEGWVVFDERKPIDLAALQQDPMFGSAQVQEWPGATLLRVKLPPGAELHLERRKSSWLVTAIGGDAVQPASDSIEMVNAESSLLLTARKPGLVVSVPDPQTGGFLLVGTQTDAGQEFPVARSSPDFVLLPSWQGVVIRPLLDSLRLRSAPQGFSIEADGGDSLSVSRFGPVEHEAAVSSRMTRMFDLPQQGNPALWRRLQSALRGAADSPPQSKANARLAVAEAMLALGLGVEAQAVLALTTNEDVRAADDPRAIGLTAIAAVLAHRLGEAAGLDDPRLDGIDEIAFWRAIRQATLQEDSPKAALVLANTVPLLEAYPPELQHRLLPLVAETLVQAGQIDAAKSLLARHPDDGTLDFARALLARKSEAADDALRRFDHLALSPDRLVRYRAEREAAELRLTTERANAAETAQTLSKMLYGWRGDQREVELRLRTAQMLGQAGQWRAALQLLRETEALWPEQKNQLHARLVASFAAALHPIGDDAASPFDQVALAEENADLMPDGAAGLQLAQLLADRLMALDLPDKASVFLEHMVAHTPPGLARAEFGGRLAEAKMLAGHPAEALDALSASAGVDLPPKLLERRGLVFAEAVAEQGDFASARQALLELDSETADRKRAELAERAKLWPEAEDAWRRVAQRSVPVSGPLDAAAADIVLRLAGAAAQTNDAAMLRKLRAEALPRLAPGKVSEEIGFLTSAPLGTSAVVTGEAHKPGVSPPGAGG